MKNRELFQRDPAVSKLLNDGVAAVREAATEKEIETLRYELEHFVCEGQYEDGLIRILESYLGNVSSTTQPAAWVSGFYGSGKSHLLKMFRHHGSIHTSLAARPLAASPACRRKSKSFCANSTRWASVAAACTPLRVHCLPAVARACAWPFLA